MATQAEAAEMGSSRPMYSTPASARIAAGIVAGALGGILMIGCMMIYASVTDAGATMPLKALGAVVYGVEALVAGPTAMLVGALIQLALSIVIGILFALCMSRETSTVAAMFAGVVVGIALWAAMDLFILPRANPTMAARIALMPLGYFVAHVAFGIGLAMSPAFMRMFARERHDRVRVQTQQILPI
ncbi:MAG TPA: hypothetical protein VLI44_01605 [Sporolactobacillaceae bacterium]|nr:hypothetical protein [Sporolactobacillaceae bacterium]